MPFHQSVYQQMFLFNHVLSLRRILEPCDVNFSLRLTHPSYLEHKDSNLTCMSFGADTWDWRKMIIWLALSSLHWTREWMRLVLPNEQALIMAFTVCAVSHVFSESTSSKYSGGWHSGRVPDWSMLRAKSDICDTYARHGSVQVLLCAHWLWASTVCVSHGIIWRSMVHHISFLTDCPAGGVCGDPCAPYPCPFLQEGFLIMDNMAAQPFPGEINSSRFSFQPEIGTADSTE